MFTTSMGYNQAYCVNSPVTEHSDTNYSEVVSFGGSPVMTGSLANVVSLSAVQQEPLDLSHTAATPLTNTVPVTFIQAPAPAFRQVLSPSKKSIWNGR